MLYGSIILVILFTTIQNNDFRTIKQALDKEIDGRQQQEKFMSQPFLPRIQNHAKEMQFFKKNLFSTIKQILKPGNDQQQQSKQEQPSNIPKIDNLLNRRRNNVQKRIIDANPIQINEQMQRDEPKNSLTLFNIELSINYVYFSLLGLSVIFILALLSLARNKQPKIKKVKAYKQELEGLLQQL